MFGNEMFGLFDYTHICIKAQNYSAYSIIHIYFLVYFITYTNTLKLFITKTYIRLHSDTYWPSQLWLKNTPTASQQGPIYRSNRTVWHLNLCSTELFEVELFLRLTDWCLVELLVIHRNTWKHETVCKQMINCKWNYSY